MSRYKKSETTKKNILEAASRLFFYQGYKNTTVRDIVKTADVSLSRMNYHFTNKENLAATICRVFLKNLNKEIYRVVQPITDKPILQDSIHIRLWAAIFLTNHECRDFYYELAAGNILGNTLFASDYEHFRDQVAYLNLDVAEEIIKAYAHTFVAVIIRFIIVKKEGDTNLSIPEILDFLNRLHLKLLEFEKDERESLIRKADEYTRNITFEISDLMNIRLQYHERSH